MPFHVHSAHAGPTEVPMPLVAQLDFAAEAMDAGQESETCAVLDRLLDDAPADGGALERVVRAFALGLKARCTGEFVGLGNLYQVGADPGHMLSAFQVLVNETPFIRFGYAAANRALAQALQGADSFRRARRRRQAWARSRRIYSNSSRRSPCRQGFLGSGVAS
jgi:hypothetical protein